MIKKQNNNLLWSKRFFYSFGKVRSVIGFDISAIYRMFGRVYLFEGLCVSKRGKNGGLLSSSLVLRRKIHNHYIFFKFFIYFGSSFRYKVTGFSFKRKFIHYSKISYARLL
jgi:hypothetical protein